MTRSERRYRTAKIAKRRLAKCGGQQLVGWFRKWNMTCRCRMCQIDKAASIEWQRMKDVRRNGTHEP